MYYIIFPDNLHHKWCLTQRHLHLHISLITTRGMHIWYQLSFSHVFQKVYLRWNRTLEDGIIRHKTLVNMSHGFAHQWIIEKQTPIQFVDIIHYPLRCQGPYYDAYREGRRLFDHTKGIQHLCVGNFMKVFYKIMITFCLHRFHYCLHIAVHMDLLNKI